MNTETKPVVQELSTHGKLCLAHVSKIFVTRNRSALEALRDINIEVREGEFLVLMGPSGCGKTTLLNLVAGFELPTSGQIFVDDKPVVQPGPDRMMIFQEHALFPWLNVVDNVIFGLRYKKGLTSSDRKETAHHYLKLVRLEKFAKSWIHELSGGMKQRVALARALAPNPRVLLMDEPLGGLDALTRERLYQQLQEVLSKSQKTIIFITHNVREASCLGDRVLVLTSRPGRIKKEILIDLPRPRRFYDPVVSRLAQQILIELKSELEFFNENE